MSPGGVVLKAFSFFPKSFSVVVAVWTAMGLRRAGILHPIAGPPPASCHNRALRWDISFSLRPIRKFECYMQVAAASSSPPTRVRLLCHQSSNPPACPAPVRDHPGMYARMMGSGTNSVGPHWARIYGQCAGKASCRRPPMWSGCDDRSGSDPV